MNYPFSPEVLDALPEAIAERYRQLEADLINEICSRLKISGQLNQVAVEAIKALRGHGISLKEIKAAISKQTGISLDELDKLLAEVVERNNVYYNGLATAADVTAPEVWLSAREIDAIARQTKNELENITQSMGFAVRVNGKVVKLVDGAEAYRWALDRATLKVQSGVVSYNEAIKDAVKELADNGIRTVRYDNNGKQHYDHIDVAARRAVMTGVSQINHRYSEQATENLETDFVEVSAHIGARDTGIGPENHKEWQGKVYHWVKDGQKQSAKYKDFIRTTGYGTGEGLGGWNCRHSFYPFIEGVSERTWADEQLTHIDDGHEVEFEGRTYTAYEATQKQRMIERTMRKLKRERDAYKAAGLEDDARNSTIRLRRLSKKYKDFSAAADLPEQRERVKVYEPKKNTTAEIFRTTSENTSKNLTVFDTDKAAEDYRKFLQTVPEKNRMILQYAYDSTPIESTDKENVVLGYDQESETILYNEKHRNFLRMYSDKALTHELAHRIDHMFSLTKGNDALSKAIETARKKVNADNSSYINYSAEKDKDGFISDIFSALDGEPGAYAYSHSSEYWAISGNKEKEIFADIFSLESTADAEKLNFLRLHFPEIMEEYDKLELEV